MLTTEYSLQPTTLQKTWIHKTNNSLALEITEIYPTILIGKVWNPYDPNENAQCMTINVSYQELKEMWEPTNDPIC
jgi:hypothetical protein